MKKTVEVEYVGVEDVQEIMDDVYAISLAGNFVSTTMSNGGGGNPLVSISIMLGGWERDKACDYSFSFFISDNERDVAEMKSCRKALGDLIDRLDEECAESERLYAENESKILEGYGYDVI